MSGWGVWPDWANEAESLPPPREAEWARALTSLAKPGSTGRAV